MFIYGDVRFSLKPIFLPSTAQVSLISNAFLLFTMQPVLSHLNGPALDNVQCLKVPGTKSVP